MRFYLTREETGDWYDLHCKTPGDKFEGIWPDGVAYFFTPEMDKKHVAAFEKEFPLEPGGGPMKVELRVVE